MKNALRRLDLQKEIWFMAIFPSQCRGKFLVVAVRQRRLFQKTFQLTMKSHSHIFIFPVKIVLSKFNSSILIRAQKLNQIRNQ
jgi:hypothetical protein